MLRNEIYLIKELYTKDHCPDLQWSFLREQSALQNCKCRKEKFVTESCYLPAGLDITGFPFSYNK